MKSLLVLIICGLSLGGIQNGLISLKGNKNIEIADLISGNMSEYNKAEPGGKPATKFERISKKLEVLDFKRKNIGEILIFDDNKGFIFYSNDYFIIKESYENGLPFDYRNIEDDKVIYDNNSFMNLSFDVLFSSKIEASGNNPSGYHFYSHTNSTFTSSKERIMLTEWDYQYNTLTSTSSCEYADKITWSTYQGDSAHCCQLALANLLWTYKVNGIIDLTNNASSASELELQFTQYLLYDDSFGTWELSVPNVNQYFNTHYPNSGYHIDFINVANGISDNLESAPLIGYYNDGTINGNGHFVLVTGKGKSLFQKILGIKFWTSWDIVNTWYDQSSSIIIGEISYPAHKYWIDNQYINVGYALKNINDETIVL